MIHVTHNGPGREISADINGEFVLLHIADWEQIQKELQQTKQQLGKTQETVYNLTNETLNLKQQLELIKKTLRNVCIDTENPIYF
jgi:chromosome segregation ATPase